MALLKRIPLGVAELAVIKDRAEKLRDGKLKLRGEALLPLSLASFIFDSLCLPSKISTERSGSWEGFRSVGCIGAPPLLDTTLLKLPTKENSMIGWREKVS